MTETGHVDAPLCLARLPLARRPTKPLPTGAIDTHFHVFRKHASLVSPRSYTPNVATLEEWHDFAAFAGIAKGVLVQPSVYGADNSVLLDALNVFPDRLRAVVVLDPDVSSVEIIRLHRLGVRGVRLNTRNKGGLTVIEGMRLAEQIAPFGWVMQLQVHAEQLPDLVPQLSQFGLPLIVDHLGFQTFEADVPEPHLALLKQLMDGRNVYVKATGAYRLTTPDHFDVFAEMVRQLACSHADRLLWGSDWPHTELWEFMPNDADLIDLMGAALEDMAQARKIFVTNAETLFFGR